MCSIHRGRINLVRQAIRDARRDGLINDSDKARLHRQVDQFTHRLDENGSLHEADTK